MGLHYNSAAEFFGSPALPILMKGCVVDGCH
jgi:hypothetical protein